MTIADFFTLVKQAELGSFDRIMVAVSPTGPEVPGLPKEAQKTPEMEVTPKP